MTTAEQHFHGPPSPVPFRCGAPGVQPRPVLSRSQRNVPRLLPLEVQYTPGSGKWTAANTRAQDMTLFSVVRLGDRIEQTKGPLGASPILPGEHRPLAHLETT